MKTPFMVICLLFLITTAYGQGKKISSREVSDTIVSVAVDRPGDFYIHTRSGQIQKFDPDGALLNLYKNPRHLTLFDPRDGARLFAYIREVQQYWYMSPSFEITTAHALDSAFAIDPWLACASGDHNVWILDKADWSVKKIDTRKGMLLADEAIGVHADKRPGDFTFMREYQGFLFLLDKTQGILIFNSIGKLIRTIPGKHIPYFNFLGEEIYFPEGGNLKLMDLFSTETRQITMPPAAMFMLMTDERTYIFYAKQVDIFRASQEARKPSKN